AKLEERIVAARVPNIEEKLRRKLVAFVQMLREQDLKKLPSISETLDWARVLLLLHADDLTPALVHDTLNVLLKFEQDIHAVRPQIAEITRKARQYGDRGYVTPNATTS
ncbi:MAG: MoxR family ATPase, partial [Rhodospirillaceae bacterium]|nr:MoxR family ATPase [Rhodospirillaceae bacterium]